MEGVPGSVRFAAQVSPEQVIDYYDKAAVGGEKGVLLLIHGYPQTAHQFRHVMEPLSEAGYRVLAPNYRGVQSSTKPMTGYTKTLMAKDLADLLDYLQITKKVHVVGHDIGGMIAWAFATRHADKTQSLVWGEGPLPGTDIHAIDRTERAVKYWHFIFHCAPDLPEALTQGNERIYLTHFYKKLSYNTAAITDADVDHYEKAFMLPGAMRAGFEIYRNFVKDGEENKAWLKQNGKLTLPSLLLHGDRSVLVEEAAPMAAEVHEPDTYENVFIPNAGHYIAEENPQAFIKEVLRWANKHQT